MFKKILYCAIIIVLFSFAVNVDAAPPKNFKSENLTKIPDLPTDIEFSPDGRMFVLGKKGKGFIIKDGKRNSKYKGDYFFGDFVKNFIRHIRFDANGKVV